MGSGRLLKLLLLTRANHATIASGVAAFQRGMATRWRPWHFVSTVVGRPSFSSVHHQNQVPTLDHGSCSPQLHFDWMLPTNARDRRLCVCGAKNFRRVYFVNPAPRCESVAHPSGRRAENDHAGELGRKVAHRGQRMNTASGGHPDALTQAHRRVNGIGRNGFVVCPRNAESQII